MTDTSLNEDYSLGIDLGTTSVKVTIVNRSDGKIIASDSMATKADIDVGDNKKSEQSVSKIFNTLQEVLDTFPAELQAKVKHIGVSGQMHGIVMWKLSSWNWGKNGIFRVNNESMTNLVTWQDRRCSQEFLDSLPDTGKHDKLSIGFGLPNLIWLQKNQKQVFDNYIHCGTIEDLLVAILTQNNGKPVMSDQNASGWGFYNYDTRTWKKELLDKINFPTNILPDIKLSGSVVGSLKTNWKHIPEGCTVGVALGDLLASVQSILYGKDYDYSAIINISTSIQLTFVMPSGFSPDNNNEDVPDIEYRPFFQGRYLAVGAGLNGGNCLAFFVSTLKSWMNHFGQNVTEDKIWEVLLQEGYNQKATDLSVKPTLKGERNAPNKTASIDNITTGNMSLGHIMRAMCSGLIENLLQILPTDDLKRYGVKQIYATGSAVLRNKILQEEIIGQFKEFNVEMCDSGDAAYAAALMKL